MRGHKYNAVRTVVDGISFPSKLEAHYYGQLKLMVKSGTVLGFLRQVPFHFQSGNKFVLDFLVFYADGRVEGIETKGQETPAWKIKKKLMDHEYPWFTLRVVK